MPVADRPEGIFFLRFRQTRPERTRAVSVADGDVRVGHQIPEPDRVFWGPTLRGDQQHLVFVGDVHEGNCPGPPGLPPYRAHETNIISAQSVPQAPAAEFADQNMKSRKQLHDPPRRWGPGLFCCFFHKNLRIVLLGVSGPSLAPQLRRVPLRGDRATWGDVRRRCAGRDS